ncbi:MAG: hypothetical protein IMW91_00160 [Firmicutes bacterium]|nr:hypothetical protein [Bacillota bacterium]
MSRSTFPYERLLHRASFEQEMRKQAFARAFQQAEAATGEARQAAEREAAAADGVQLPWAAQYLHYTAAARQRAVDAFHQAEAQWVESKIALRRFKKLQAHHLAAQRAEQLHRQQEEFDEVGVRQWWQQHR